MEENITPDAEVAYMDIVVTHMLHRIWELQAAQLMLFADSEEDEAFVQDIIDKQRKGDYTTPLEW